jgi:hypothetical protein
MGNFHARIHHLSHHIPLYLKNIAVCDVMKYRYLKGIRQVFDDKNGRLSTLSRVRRVVFELITDQIPVSDQKG